MYLGIHADNFQAGTIIGNTPAIARPTRKAYRAACHRQDLDIATPLYRRLDSRVIGI
jgi:hypothetical protein